MKVIKRDGSYVNFDINKIIIAILKAYMEVDKDITEDARKSAEEISSYIYNLNQTMSVENIQNIVEEKLMESERKDVAREYIQYRFKRNLIRETNTTDKSILELLNGTNEYWNKENSNKNAKIVTTQRDYLAGITSTDITRRFLMDKDIREAHDNGIIHFHDADYFAQLSLHNCDLINLEDMLQNGTVINGVMVEKPHRFITACTIATQIITAVASSQYGGCTISLTHLAPFIRNSLDKIKEEVLNELKDQDIKNKQELINSIVDKRIKSEIKSGVQTFNYQINSMSTTNGQAPFLSVFMYLGETKEYKKELSMLIEEFLNQRIIGMKNEVGVYITQAFPKLLYVLEEDNIHEDSKYYYLTELAAKCTAKRMVPDYISEKKMLEYKIDKTNKGAVYPCMGCRSFLTPDRTTKNISKCRNYDPNKGKYYGRFNQGVVTINLPDIAFSSKGDINLFWKLFDERMELCHRALQLRHNRLSLITSDVAPILWQHGALARLNKGEKIEPLLHGGYSTISLGYAGLYECVKYITKHSHTDKDIGEKFGLKIMEFLNKKCNEWKNNENIDYSPYGSPIESTTYKFAKCLKKRFGKD